MRILLTGGSGMVGRNIREAVEGSKHQVLAPARRELDLSNTVAVSQYVTAHKPEMIIHAAGKVGGIQANMRDPLGFMIENLDAGRNIVVAAMQAGVPRLINLATCCIYPCDAENPLREEQVLTGRLEPTNEGYALAKIAVMRLCSYISHARQDLAYKTLVPCNIYGRYDNFDLERGHMVPAVIARLHHARQNGTEIEIWGDGSARREFMYAGDLASAVWRAVDAFDTLPDVINIGPGHDYSVDEYYDSIAEAVGYRGRFVHDLSKPAGMRRKLLDVSRMTAWGFAPSHSLKAGIRLTYQHYLENVAH
jgi:GDP-L-fucose synthase